MNDKTVEKIIEDSYDESKEEGLRSIVRDFYSRKLLASVVAAWTVAAFCIAVAVFSGVQFLRMDETKWQIMYAALFVVSAHGLDVVKIFAWQLAHRQNLKRDIKRLELRIAELSAALKK
ncbi:DUF6768 family protein [Opitutus sp. ER46]|uniref:DUF6768 family protein n=1 Tax=Opitutus sp. ER46 TaxID=2161864 RepID=UPI000D30841E|nr:DUF6768 family protein [Opitutus sp. ER46]PTX97790.1 hypothetical protein DB354_05800 [Opitutus sp. ER46]